MMSKEEIDEAVSVWLGRFIILKYSGYAALGISIGLIVVFSLLQIFALSELLQTGILVGIALIVIGIIGERILSL